MELFNYQQKAVDKAVKVYENNGDRFNLFFEMGLGKTLTAIEIVKRIEHYTILIVCPKSLIEMWAYEMAKHFPKGTRLNEPYGNYLIYDCCYYITNYENIRSYKSMLAPDICIFDEVHKLKNHKSLTHKCIQRFLHPTFTLCLTGTPITRNYMDLFGILTCVGKSEYLDLTPAQFEAKYVKNVGAKTSRELMKSIEPFTVFANITDTIDMPEYEDIIIPVTLSAVEYAKLDSVYRSNMPALARIVEAQKITSNVYGRKSLALTRLVSDIIEDGRKVVIFTKFDEEFDFLMYQYKDIAVGINGKTKDRDTPVFEFQNKSDIKIFIGNMQTAGMGLTLTAAHDCIFYSETYTWGDADQSRARIYRIGQKYPCKYYHLLAKDTIDEMIYKNLIEKTDLIEEFKKTYGGD